MFCVLGFLLFATIECFEGVSRCGPNVERSALQHTMRHVLVRFHSSSIVRGVLDSRNLCFGLDSIFATSECF